MGVRTPSGAPAPVAPLPPREFPKSVHYSMVRSVQFSVAMDSCRRRCAVTRSKRKTDAFTEPRSPEQRDAPRSWARLSNPQSRSGCFLPRLVVDVMPTVTSAPSTLAGRT